MKVSLNWLKELVNYNLSPQQLADLLSLKTIGVKQVTDDFLELDLTYNRGDLLSLRGVAREVAAITGSNTTFIQEAFPQYDLPKVSVKVENSSLCPFYYLVKIEGLKSQPSNPDWVKKLTDSGVRSVNNITDVTNLIMLEYGQPMHAFDSRGVKDESIIVRTAKPKERITTLDGKTRDLNTEDLLIADSQNALGIAGVMGGKDSEVSETTTSILLEAAIFDPVAIRNTSKRLGLYSEASKRFQHGLSKTNLLQALNAAIKMYESLGGKLTAITLVGNLENQPKSINLSQQKVNSLVGVNISPEQIEGSLTKLGFTLASHLGGGNVFWEVTVPYFRMDINIEEDLIEEVARMYGYEKIPAKELTNNIPTGEENPLFKRLESLKQALLRAGLTEIQTYSFYSSAIIERLELKTENLIRIANPISSETAYLRDDLWPNLLEVTAKNLRNGFKDIAIFEIGKVYHPKKGELPDEPYRLSIALVNGTNNPIQELYQIFNSVKDQLKGVEVNTNIKKGEYEVKYCHPNRIAFLEKDGKQIGGISEVHPRIVNKFGVDQRIAILEIEI